MIEQKKLKIKKISFIIFFILPSIFYAANTENVFIIGYSLPETDSFFRYLFALGSEGDARLRNFIVINTDDSGATEQRFRKLIGRGIEDRFRYIPASFDQRIGHIMTKLSNN